MNRFRLTVTDILIYLAPLRGCFQWPNTTVLLSDWLCLQWISAIRMLAGLDDYGLKNSRSKSSVDIRDD